MAGLQMFLLMCFLGLLSLSAAQSDQKNNSTDMMEEDTSVERKKNDGMEQMYMMVMMFKGAIQTIMGLISPIIQIKSFGLMMIGTIINLVRLVAMLKNMNQSGGSGSSWDGNRRYATMAPHIVPAVHPSMHSYSAPYSSYYPTYGSDEKVM